MKESKICIEWGLLNHFEIPLSHKNIAIVTHSGRCEEYARKIQQRLSGKNCYIFTFEGGEQHKNRKTKEWIEDQLIEKKLGRDTLLIAVGGGVVTDLGGFIAATYCRGIPLIHVPTTLLAMVDASLGGKNGVNVSVGKNMIGTVYQPDKILIDPTVLQTLPLAELRNGIVEMIKHGLICDAAYFEFLKLHCEALLNLDPPILSEAIKRSCEIKLGIVEKDPFEKGLRRLLNLGHTIGHALELISHYTLPHGEAVAIGILAECHLSSELGFFNHSHLDTIRNLFLSYGLPLQLPDDYSFDKLINYLVLDKKSVNSKPRFVLLKDIGEALSFNEQYCYSVENELIQNALEWLKKNACSIH